MEPALQADGTGGRGGSPAPELSVHGTGLAPVTIASLTAGGCALLVFVSEHCPTSALALRRLGPLCQAWARAGLTAVAILRIPWTWRSGRPAASAGPARWPHRTRRTRHPWPTG